MDVWINLNSVVYVVARLSQSATLVSSFKSAKRRIYTSLAAVIFTLKIFSVVDIKQQSDENIESCGVLVNIHQSFDCKTFTCRIYIIGDN